MPDIPRILLVDDGELNEVAKMLDGLQVDHTRLRGGQVEDDLAPPTHLLIATPRRAEAVRRGSPAGAPEGQPLRIIAVDEDSNAMRRMLRRMGFHLLVRRGVHPDVWRLLVERALFQGDERRTEERVPVGAPVSISSRERSVEGSDDEARQPALLVDISNRGCRLSTSELVEPGTKLSISVRLDDQGGETLQLRGRLVRSSTQPSSRAHGYTAAMLFDTDMPEEDRRLLTHLLNDLSVGPGSLTYGPADALPPCESPVIPGLTLDAETDPAFHAGVKIELEQQPAESAEARPPADVIDLNRRRSPRGNFTSRVVATPGENESSPSRVLMGRDLSAGGMRIDKAPDLAVGQRFRLALYGPARHEPFLIEARIERDDGDHGLGLAFLDVSEESARDLEKLVACLPDVESLEDGETGGMGTVISEIISRTED
jgi:hypothetical protein